MARYRLHGFERDWCQVERMTRTLKEAAARRYDYETHRRLEDHLAAFLDAYNFAKRSKTLRSSRPRPSARPGRTSWTASGSTRSS